jgi:hypothetical protein
MKNIHFLLLGFILLAAFGCKTDPPELGEPFSKIEGIADDWELIELHQVDLLTKNDDNSIDLSDMFIGGTPAKLSFSTDFSYTGSANSSKMYFPTAGTWAFDNNDYPSQLFITSGGETVTLELLAPVRERVDPYLHVRYVRPFNGCAPPEVSTTGAVAYDYKFERR